MNYNQRKRGLSASVRPYRNRGVAHCLHPKKVALRTFEPAISEPVASRIFCTQVKYLPTVCNE